MVGWLALGFLEVFSNLNDAVILQKEKEKKREPSSDVSTGIRGRSREKGF